MATVQALSFNQDKSISAGFPTASLASTHSIMGSVGSLIEKAEVSPTKTNRAVPQVPGRPSHGLLKKGFNQRELLNYLNITKKEAKGGKHIISGTSTSFKREHRPEEELVYTKVFYKDGKEVDLGKNSLPIGGKFDKPRFRPSAFKPVMPKNFSSMQNLFPSKSNELERDFPLNMQHPSYPKTPPKSLSTSSSSSSPSHPDASKRATTSSRGLSQDEENASDSGHNSVNSLPPYRPPFRPHTGQISASMGHINHIGSLDRAKGGSSTVTEMSCRSMATLNRLQGYGSEAPGPYGVSQSIEDVIRDLEERLQEKEVEIRHMRRNLDESEDAIAQVFEGKQRLWEKELTELKQLYTAKLRQVSQQSQRSQRNLQLQLFKAQQERNRVQEELETLRHENLSLKSQGPEAQSQSSNPQLEESQWEVCQKSGEISLLKQQLRDAQSEVTQKLSEIFLLKTQLHEARNQIQNKDGQIESLQTAIMGARRKCLMPGLEDIRLDPSDSGVSSTTEERLRAELLLERRQNEAQNSTFESERRTWQNEKEKVIRYQKELQASYLEMHHKNESLERELSMLRGGGGEARVGEKSGPLQETMPQIGLPWIERIESSDI